MKSNSNNIPQHIMYLGNGKYHINFAVETVIIDNVTSYSYQTAEVSGVPDYSSIINAILRCDYTIDSEFAIINNYADGIGIDSYIEYQKKRNVAKTIATNVIAGNLITKSQYDSYFTAITSNWVQNEIVVINTQRMFQGIKYKCIQAHTTQSAWTPPIVPALWEVVATSSAWTVGVAYAVNAQVTYLTHTYKCLQAHTSQAGWTPVAVPALWQLVS